MHFHKMPEPKQKLTKPQRLAAERLFEKGFVPWFTSYRSLPRHRCYHRLMDIGLADFSTRRMGYQAIWSDPVC